MSKKGLLVVISGPSGSGKSTICDLLSKKMNDLCLSISATTRAPREGEKHGINYFFTTEEDFKDKIQKNHFLEWAKVHNNYYGTPKDFVERQLELGKDVILEIDTKGAFQIKENFSEGVFVFILPPSLEELKRRLKDRGSETEESFKLRFKTAQDELKVAHLYDYFVINDVLEDAVLKLQSIIVAEKCRSSKNMDLLQNLKGGL